MAITRETIAARKKLKHRGQHEAVFPVLRVRSRYCARPLRFRLVLHRHLDSLRSHDGAHGFWAFCDFRPQVPEVHLTITHLAIGYIAHECVHLVCRHLDRRYSEEAYADLLGGAVQAIVNAFERAKLTRYLR